VSPHEFKHALVAGLPIMHQPVAAIPEPVLAAMARAASDPSRHFTRVSSEPLARVSMDYNQVAPRAPRSPNPNPVCGRVRGCARAGFPRAPAQTATRWRPVSVIGVPCGRLAEGRAQTPGADRRVGTRVEPSPSLLSAAPAAA